MSSAAMKEKHDMIVALQARIRKEHPPGCEHRGFLEEAAMQYGFANTGDCENPTYTCTPAQLTEFGLAAEAAGHFTFAQRAGIEIHKALEILNRCEK